MALLNLALSEACKTPLRAHSGVMKGLRLLEKDAMSEAAAKSASAALFELDETTRQKTKEAAAATAAALAQTSNTGSIGDDAATGSEHVMLSYNWSHQDIIKRLHVALKARGYVVWIDIEKMQGSTIDVRM